MLLGWDRYDSRAAVEAINAIYRQELRWWMNLYLLLVKLVKKYVWARRCGGVYSSAGGRNQEASLYAGSLCISADYRSQARELSTRWRISG